MKLVIKLVLKLCYLVPGMMLTLRRFNKNKEKYPFLERSNYVRKKLRLIMKKAKVHIEVEGMDQLPKEAFVAYGNHQSNFDPLILIMLLDRPTSIVAKKELENVPLVGPAIKSIDGLFMDRDDLKQSITVIKEVTRRVKEEDLSYAIFPEGTRSLSHDMLPFKPGAFKAAMKAKSPIVPMCINNAFSIMEIPEKNPFVQVKILEPINYDEYKDLTSVEISHIVQGRIQLEIEKMNGKS